MIRSTNFVIGTRRARASWYRIGISSSVILGEYKRFTSFLVALSVMEQRGLMVW